MGSNVSHRSPTSYRNRVVAGLAAFLAVAVTGCGPAGSPRPVDDVTTVPARSAPAVGSQYPALWPGVTPADRTRMADSIAATGATWARLDVAWGNLQPTSSSSYDLRGGVAQVDDAVNRAHAAGLKVLFLFYGTPPWAGTGSRESHPRDPGQYAAALAWAVQRWHGKVQAVEVWNEPNQDRFFDPPSAATYTTLLRMAYRRVKAVAPGVTVVSAGTAYTDTSFLSEMYAAGARGSFDALAVHPYPSPSDLPPGAPADGSIYRFRNLSQVVALMRRYGDGSKPVWLTEIGWSAHADAPGTPAWARGVSEATQAAYLRQMFTLLRSAYPQVRGVFWYTLRDDATGNRQEDHFGLLRRDWSRRPAWYALRDVLSSAGPRGGDATS